MKTQSECVLVTGGAGFLGLHLCERRLGEGKRCAEDLFFNYYRLNQLRIR